MRLPASAEGNQYQCYVNQRCRHVVFLSLRQVERLLDPIAPVSEILSRVPSKQLMSLYKVSAFDGVDAFLQQVATARGKLKRGGIVDVEVRLCL
jgi:nuclear GTP-binding protein